MTCIVRWRKKNGKVCGDVQTEMEIYDVPEK